MTPADTLLALAVRAEIATGPDRELDYAIHESIHGEWLRRNAYTREPGDDGWASPTPPVKGANFIAAPQSYTASLDAAMTLVPEGCRLRGFGEGKSGHWTADLASRDDRRCLAIGSHPTSSRLALCAASLRARAALASGVAK